MRSPFRIVPGSAASVGRGVLRRENFSLPFNSLMSSVSGSIARSLAAAGLSSSVALNVLLPMVIFIILPFDSLRGSSRWTAGSVVSQPTSPTIMLAAKRRMCRALHMASPPSTIHFSVGDVIPRLLGPPLTPLDRLAAVDDQSVPDDKSGRVRAQPDDGLGNLLGSPHPTDRLLSDDPLASFGSPFRKPLHHRGGDNARAHSVDPDVG